MKKIFTKLSAIITFALFLQSCSMEHVYLKGSIDGNVQTFSGPSYPASSPFDSDLGWNIGLVMLGMPEDPQNLREYHGGPYSLVNPQANKFYASTGRDYSSFINEKNNIVPVKTKPDDFMDHLTYMGGIEFIQKNSGDGGDKSSLNYIEAPLYAIYYTPLLNGKVFGGLGPYFAYGIGGTNSYNGQSSSVSPFNSTSGFKRFDAGLGLTAGYKLPGSFYFSFGYSFGLTNIQQGTSGDKAKNSGYSLNVGYPISKLISKIGGHK